MKSILKQFYLGNLITNPPHIKPNSPLSHAVNSIVESEDKLMAMLNDEGKKILEKFSSTQMEVNALSCADNFLYGYKLGALMTMEVLNGMDDLIIGKEGE
jgi:DNA integrity scanning protein DisA with diadenylate cyclase activity